MYKTDEQINNRTEGAIAFKERNGNGRGKALSHDERVFIGTMGKFDTARNVAQEFGTCPSNVSILSRGLTGNINFNKNLKDEVDKNSNNLRGDIVDHALSSLMSSLNIVDSTIGKTNKATDASIVAKNLSTIVNNLEGKDRNAAVNNIQVVIDINGALQKEEKEYETISV